MREKQIHCANCGDLFLKLDWGRKAGLHSYCCSPKCRILIDVERDPVTDCWVWQGSKFSAGYGQIYGLDRYGLGAHRVSYVAFKGPIPRDLVIDHLCRNKPCVNPEHLEAVTNEGNVRRGNLGIAKRAKSHCLRDHPFVGKNLIKKANGTRGCRECHNMHQRNRNKDKSNGYQCEVVSI